uniref:L1 transposable element RRM domain-containing protein n=1 Tax=Latimeria chalumnae TaxID=7897 RepID=H3ABD3_LATCH
QIMKEMTERPGTKIAEAEGRISNIEDQGQRQEERIHFLNHVDDLENRSRRNNIRIVRFPEGVEGGNPIKFLTMVIPELNLGPDVQLDIEQAHRTLPPPRPQSGQRPRAFIIKLLKYPVCELILKVARDKGLVKWQDNILLFFFFSPLDFSKELQQHRQKFTEIQKKTERE